ncbi:MAG TPA: ATP-binding protein [Treponemataceae bacterium]|jgi:PAS domain S-box-containing protein|nr:ATP-binding protein [Treponemataceae bacterium]HPX14177.1 ATP-binding protein [Treponemataceae bacterium]
MREFIRRALQKTSRMNGEQIQSLLTMITEEYEMLDAVLDSLGTGLLICDAYHVVVQNNKAATRILPMDYHDYQERPVWACIHDPEISAFVEETIEKKETVTAREFPLNDEHTPKILSLSVMPLVKSKQVRGTIIMIDDITDKKKEELKNRRLESLASLTNLAANVAHEIKNPLGSISIHVQLVRKAVERLTGADTCSICKYLDVVDEEMERLNKIVVDFLFAVRPISFEFTALNINELIQDLAQFLAGEFEQAGISIDLDLVKDIPQIQGDERFLRQMLINLLKNAKAAMEGGGIARLATRFDDETIRITVEDTGTGIPDEVLNKIFEPYFTTKIDGTGLGLTMVYKVVKGHGGDITVQSRPSLGTRFTIQLPIYRRARKMLEYEE